MTTLVLVLVLAGAVVIGAAIRGLPKAMALARAARAWRRAAAETNGTIDRAWFSLSLTGSLAGRPVAFEVVERRQGKYSVQNTRVIACTRHPDDVVMRKAAPPTDVQPWIDAWQDADILAKMAGLPRSEYFGNAVLETEEPGVCTDPGKLVAIARRLAGQAAAVEQLVARWRDAASALEMRAPGAWLLEGAWRGGWVRIMADPPSNATVVRARVEPRGPGDDRWTDAARSLAEKVKTSSATYDQFEVRVVLDGVEPDVPRWRDAIALATALAEGTDAGPYR